MNAPEDGMKGAPPLHGVRVVEMAGIGPAPFAAMMLADQGADVIRIERSAEAPRIGRNEKDILNRSRRSIALDLKTQEGVAVARRLVKGAHAVIEGYRPGAMERLGLGPDILLQDNPRLVYGRMTGWGQDGPLARAAGHDINYIALAGNLSTYGRAGQAPTPPINAVGDFGGGGMMLAFGVLAGLLAVRAGRPGHVVDCAMIDGAALLAAMTWSFRAMGVWNEARGANLLDTGAPFYDVYETADGEYVSIGAIEPQFYAALRQALSLNDDLFDDQLDQSRWPAQRAHLEGVFKSRTRAHWVTVFEGVDACFAPVLSMSEAPEHSHMKARGVFARVDDVVQPAPAPRFSGMAPRAPHMPGPIGAEGGAILHELGYAPEEIEDLTRRGILRRASR